MGGNVARHRGERLIAWQGANRKKKETNEQWGGGRGDGGGRESKEEMGVLRIERRLSARVTFGTSSRYHLRSLQNIWMGLNGWMDGWNRGKNDLTVGVSIAGTLISLSPLKGFYLLFLFTHSPVTGAGWKSATPKGRNSVT